MCGIAGLVGTFIPGLGAQMNAAQAHRGPDGSGVFEDSKAGAMLAHVRLAILDLSDNAAQPMYTTDGRFVLVFNGEIYNFKELRRVHETDGICCRRGSMLSSCFHLIEDGITLEINPLGKVLGNFF